MFKKLFGKQAPASQATPKAFNPFQPTPFEATGVDDLKSGDLLASMPFFQDPKFDETVIMLLGKSEAALIGVVLNRPSEEGTAMDYPILGGSKANIQWGGPVSSSQLYCMHRLEQAGKTLNISEHLNFELDLGAFLGKYDVKHISDDQAIFYKGLVQWSADQLDREVKSKDWVFARGEINLLDYDNSRLWHAFFPGFEAEVNHKILPRFKANYAHEMYANDQGKSFTEGNGSLDIPEGLEPLSRNFTDDLLLCFVEDGEHFLSYLQPSFFKHYPHFDTDILERLAVRNLIYEVGQHVQLRGALNDVVMVTAGGDFEAAIVTMEALMDHLHDQFGGNLVLAIPAQDLLYITQEENQIAIDKIKGLVQQLFENPETQGLLSKGIYLRKKGQGTLELVGQAF